MAVCFSEWWDVVDHVGCARANRNSCDFSVKAINALVPSRRMKTVISPTRNLHIFFRSRLHNCSAVLCLQQRWKFFQKPFKIWILQAWSPAPHEHILCSGGVQSRMFTLFAFQNHVSWQEIFQRLPGPVQRLGTANVGDAWKQLGTFWREILRLMNHTSCTGMPRLCAAAFQAPLPSGQMI